MASKKEIAAREERLHEQYNALLDRRRARMYELLNEGNQLSIDGDDAGAERKHRQWDKERAEFEAKGDAIHKELAELSHAFHKKKGTRGLGRIKRVRCKFGLITRGPRKGKCRTKPRRSR